MTETTDPRPWFKAKTRGWGWGVALTWQGWLAYGLYVALAAASLLVLPPPHHVLAFGVCLWILTLLLIGVCWVKGEDPGPHWGR